MTSSMKDKFSVTIRTKITIGVDGRNFEIPIKVNLSQDEVLTAIWDQSDGWDNRNIVTPLVLSCLGDEPTEGLADIFEAVTPFIRSIDFETDDRDRLLEAMAPFMR